MIEERVAILEAKLDRTEQDIAELLKFMRDRIEKEDADRDKILELIADIDGNLKMQRSFWAGMLFAFTGIGSLIGGAIAWFKN